MIVLATFEWSKVAQKPSDCDLCYFCVTKSNQKSLGEADLSKNISTRMFVKTRNRLRAYSDKLTNKEVFMR